MRFFFDRCVPIPLARMVRGAHAGTHLILHQDEDPVRFPQTMPDIAWMNILAQDPPWAIVSGDGRILKNAVERTMLATIQLPAFFMEGHWNNLQFDERAWKFMKVWPMIAKEGATPLKQRPFFSVFGRTQQVGIRQIK